MRYCRYWSVQPRKPSICTPKLMVASWMFVPHLHGLAPSLMFDSSGQHVDLGQICMQGFFGAVSSVAAKWKLRLFVCAPYTDVYLHHLTKLSVTARLLHIAKTLWHHPKWWPVASSRARSAACSCCKYFISCSWLSRRAVSNPATGLSTFHQPPMLFCRTLNALDSDTLEID
jgi:hypothetical protein